MASVQDHRGVDQARTLVCRWPWRWICDGGTRHLCRRDLDLEADTTHIDDHVSGVTWVLLSKQPKQIANSLTRRFTKSCAMSATTTVKNLAALMRLNLNATNLSTVTPK